MAELLYLGETHSGCPGSWWGRAMPAAQGTEVGTVDGPGGLTRGRAHRLRVCGTQWGWRLRVRPWRHRPRAWWGRRSAGEAVLAQRGLWPLEDAWPVAYLSREPPVCDSPGRSLHPKGVCLLGGGRALRHSGGEFLGFSTEPDRTVQVPDFGSERGSREPGRRPGLCPQLRVLMARPRGARSRRGCPAAAGSSAS